MAGRCSRDHTLHFTLPFPDQQAAFRTKHVVLGNARVKEYRVPGVPSVNGHLQWARPGGCPFESFTTPSQRSASPRPSKPLKQKFDRACLPRQAGIHNRPPSSKLPAEQPFNHPSKTGNHTHDATLRPALTIKFSSTSARSACCTNAADGCWYTTARVLNSSKMRSRSSALCSSEKACTGGSGGLMTRCASSSPCCSSLRQPSCVDPAFDSGAPCLLDLYGILRDPLHRSTQVAT